MIAKRRYNHFLLGFTLIELLVVITILGVLSAIVLSALSSARGKSRDAAIKEQLIQVRSQAGIIFNSFGCFGDGTTCAATAFNGGTAGVCAATAGTLFAEAKVNDVITNAAKLSGASTIAGATCASAANQTAWAVSVPLSGGTHWCVDSKNVARVQPSALSGSQTACP